MIKITHENNLHLSQLKTYSCLIINIKYKCNQDNNIIP